MTEMSTRSLRSFLQKSFYSATTHLLGDQAGYVNLPVLTGPVRGLHFRLKLTSNSEGSIFAGTYERAVAKRLAALMQPGWTIWDCGTFIGYYTLLFARAVGKKGHVVAFEPDPVNFRRTRDNARLNHFDNVQMMDVAIGEPSRELTFVSTHDQTSHLSGTYVGDSGYKGTEKPNTQTLIKVHCVSLNEMIELPSVPRPQFIKLDLEGAEALALQHADKLVQISRPIMAVELHNHDCDEAMWKFCETHRYSLSSLVKGSPISKRAELGGIVLAMPK